MIRHLDGRKPTRDRLARHARHRAHMAWQWDVPADCDQCGIDCGGRCAREVGPHTEIRRCPVCRHLHALQTHDELLCARRRGVSPERAPKCAGRCGAVVAGEGSVCISCVSVA